MLNDIEKAGLKVKKALLPVNLDTRLNFYRARLAVIIRYNQLFEEIYPRLNFTFAEPYPTNRDDPAQWSLENRIRSTRYVLMSLVKEPFFDLLRQTTNSNAVMHNINLNRFKASDLQRRNMVDWEGKYSVFGQLMTRFGTMPGKSFRVGKNARMFTVHLEGEGAQDMGGPYRDVMENMCKELKSEHLPLFELCANGKAEIGENRDAYIPVEISTNKKYRKSQIKMYEFLGQLFGLAIRSLGYLNLSLAPFVWKRILGDNLTIHDILSVDQGTAKMLQNIGKDDEHVPEIRIGNGEMVKGTKENKAKIFK